MAAGTDPEQPTGRQVIEPTRIFRAVTKPDREGDPPADGWMEDLDLFRPLVEGTPPRAYDLGDADTEEFELGLRTATEPPSSAAPADSTGSAGSSAAHAAPAAPPFWRRSRPAALAAAGAVGAGLALTLVLLIPGADGSTAAQPDPGSGTPSGRTSAPAAPTASAAPPSGDGQGGQGEGQDAVLSLGDSGPEVSELQSRLLRIPDVYTGGSVNGQYDQSLASAVARFQLWYGIRGDEDGVYGDDTRRDLESRT
ncbi:peptidoglycan-binding domain-containing protein [Streptomyces milbemycinicus]|uniref:Peptidoglycan-binding domain-containing protein n=1 Tax=Streptomyces milbemycinicus TaxID=476552 RepID=A0ABW8LJX2_9ACTN